jgi:CRISPR/Cas system CSM-associated protein Csm2 small subunit
VQSLHSPKVTSILAKGSIAALSCMVSISKDQYSNPVIIPLIIGSKNQNIIREVPQFEGLRTKSLRIKLIAKLEYVYTSILTYLGKHPENLVNDDSIQLLSFENLYILLRYKHLNLKTEDQALDMLGKWVAKSMKLSDESISKLLETIRWDFVSLRALINSMRSYAELKTYKLYQEIFKRELEKRAGSESILHLSKTQLKPRVSYKNSIDKETFSSPEEFLESLSELILELEYAPYEMLVSSTQEEELHIKELTSKIASKDKEIKEVQEAIKTLKASKPFSYSPQFRSPSSIEDSPYRRSFLSATSQDSPSPNLDAILGKKSNKLIQNLVSNVQERAARRLQSPNSGLIPDIQSDIPKLRL